MQPLSAPISDLLFLPCLFNLECNHYFEKPSDNLDNSLPLVEDPAAFQRGRGRVSLPAIASLLTQARRAGVAVSPSPLSPPARGGEGGCRAVFSRLFCWQRDAKPTARSLLEVYRVGVVAIAELGLRISDLRRHRA